MAQIRVPNYLGRCSDAKNGDRGGAKARRIFYVYLISPRIILIQKKALRLCSSVIPSYGIGKTVLVRLCHPLHFFNRCNNLRHHLKCITNYAIVGGFKEWRLRIFINYNNTLTAVYSGQVLDGTRYADSKI